jgi:hypothetical protein
MGYLDKALETMQQQGGRVINHDLLDATLREIGETYRPGLISWIKEDRSRWRRLLTLEDRINQAALSKDDPGLKTVLSAYKDFITEMLKAFEMANSLPLFGRREHE